MEKDEFYKEKFFVVKNDVIKEELDYLRQQDDTIYENILAFLRNISNANGEKEYLVVNQDEPYAQQVYDLIKENEKKKIVAFIGRAGSGKDFQCNILEKHGYKKLAFADALRDIAFTSLGLKNDEDPEYYSQHYEWYKAHDCITIYDHNSDGRDMNFRRFLELLGTQGIRKYDPDFWCRCLTNVIKIHNYNKICVSDMRFLNEYYWLQQFAVQHGYEFEVIFCDYKSDRYQKDNPHQSAKMGNYFATHGYVDLQPITEEDMLKYEDYDNLVGKKVLADKV